MTTNDRRGYSSSSNNLTDCERRSALSKMQQQYWEAKQALIRKLKKKEDDCIVNSDSQLDTKLELFHSIEETSTNLLLVLEALQDRICSLSYEENAFGRFLKECGKVDKTAAGSVMVASGKGLSYMAQQQFLMRSTLVRLYQEVETFQYRAVTDTFVTIEKMEKARTAYRGALLWMKNVSQELDPDTRKQMERFRRVQSHVRRTKARFERLKVDTLQKIDMLSASRCNMLNSSLVAYQNGLLTFWEKTGKTMNTIASALDGHHQYEFDLLKNLTDLNKVDSKTPASEIEAFKLGTEKSETDRDKLIFFNPEYHDEPVEGNETEKASEDSSADLEKLVTLKAEANNFTNSSEKALHLIQKSSLSDDLVELNEILCKFNEENSLLPLETTGSTGTKESYLPSQLLGPLSDLCLNPTNVNQGSQFNSNKAEKSKKKSVKIDTKNVRSSDQTKEWFNLFAELDPLANPDAIGKGNDAERNC